MIGMNGFRATSSEALGWSSGGSEVIWILLLLWLAFKFPNIQQWMAYFKPGITDEPIEKRKSWEVAGVRIPVWRPNLLTAVFIAAMILICFFKMYSSTSKEFIYYNF
jgi:hypothetical protein